VFLRCLIIRKDVNMSAKRKAVKKSPRLNCIRCPRHKILPSPDCTGLLPDGVDIVCGAKGGRSVIHAYPIGKRVKECEAPDWCPKRKK